ncbi:MAG: hypothetical protein KatS3mg027_0579 [Bacteroidia bacterium]|nr:MAG: hypothetical protein KatS3mg027_0579 [Bacteroidia bacterium]
MPYLKNYLVCGLLIILTFHKTFSQCCSANPVVGSTNIGLLSQNTLRVIAFYRYNFSDIYFESNKKRTDIQYLKYSLYSYVGNILSYGITRKFTVDLEMGYYLKKAELTNVMRKIETNGWNNGIMTIKYGLIKRTTFECTIGGGLKFPLTQQLKEQDGRPLSVSLQPSTNAFGAIGLLFVQKSFPEHQFRIFVIHRSEVFNGYNRIYYMKGNAFTSSLFLSKGLNTHWNALLQIRNEYRTRDYYYDRSLIGTGGILLFVSPQINYSFKGYNFSFIFDIPVYRHVNEIQIVSRYAFSFICTKDFNF